VPLVVARSTSLGAAHGLLIRNRAAFERARILDVVVFDKTGTLTEGRFGVEAVVTLADGWGEDEILRYAAALEGNSEHPIAQGILAGAKERDLQLPSSEAFHNLTGRGAEAKVAGRWLKVISPGYADELEIEYDHAAVEQLATGGSTVVIVSLEGQALGAIALGDVIRTSSRKAITNLQAHGIRCMMLTGDNESVARHVAEELMLDDYFAGVLPGQKAERIRALRQGGERVAMIGDGVNDAPALVEADLGIAIGAGTDVAIESADVVLVRNDPRQVAVIVALSQATYRKMLQNLAWATGYNLIAIPVAAGVAVSAGIVLSPAVGAALMSISTVVVAINARLLQLSGLSAED
jgi:Cu2+-exporting ATPase